MVSLIGRPSSIMPFAHNLSAVSSSCLAFFSDRRIATLSKRLGHTRVTDLIRRVDAAVQGAVCGPLKELPSSDDCIREARPISLSNENRSKFITCPCFYGGLIIRR